MLRQQIANLFYEILTSFPRELTQLLAEYVDILPTKYTLISNAWPEGFFPAGFEVIPNKGLVLYDIDEKRYQKIDLREKGFRTESGSNDDKTLCIVNESGDDFIIYHNRDVDKLIDSTYLLAYDGVCKYSLTTPELEVVIPGDFVFIDKVREGFIVQTEKMDNGSSVTMNTFMYDRHMANPVKLTTPYDRIRRIIETARHLYVIDSEGDMYIDNKHVDVPNEVYVLGIYQDHLVGVIFNLVGNFETLVMHDGTGWRVLYTNIFSTVCDIKCFENEIYALIGECLYKLSEEMVV